MYHEGSGLCCTSYIRYLLPQVLFRPSSFGVLHRHLPKIYHLRILTMLKHKTYKRNTVKNLDTIQIFSDLSITNTFQNINLLFFEKDLHPFLFHLFPLGPNACWIDLKRNWSFSFWHLPTKFHASFWRSGLARLGSKRCNALIQSWSWGPLPKILYPALCLKRCLSLFSRSFSPAKNNWIPDLVFDDTWVN